VIGRTLALKVLPAEKASKPERLERFQREAKALAALDHPGIVTVCSVEEADGVHFLTMQLVEGQPPVGPDRQHAEHSEFRLVRSASCGTDRMCSADIWSIHRLGNSLTWLVYSSGWDARGAPIMRR